MAQLPVFTFGRGKNVTKPWTTYVGSDRVRLRWTTEQHDISEGCCFDIYYKEHNKGKWKPYKPELSFKDTNILITKLKAETSYVFKVKIVSEETDDEGPFSMTSDMITTNAFERREIPDGSRLISSNPIQQYQLYIQEDKTARNDEMKIRKFTLGEPSPQIQEKTILLVGATGSGKSTLVNAIANYILDVRWDDSFRLVLIDQENDELHQTQAVSQTSWVTCYKIYTGFSSPLKYNINIIDTPGFGHTGGVEFDTNILSQLKELFTSPSRYDVSFISAVCIVVKAPDARLTASQQYIFKSVLSLFGKDILENICTIVTFADGEKPPVIASLAELEDTPLPYKKYFPVNNSALYADNGVQGTISSTFWMLGIKSYSDFFENVQNLRTQSLCLTANVLSLRDAVDNTIQNLKDVLKVAVGNIDTVEQEISEFEKHKEEIKRNQDFTYEVVVTERTTVTFSKSIFGKTPNTTTCTVCNFTCHKNCTTKQNEKKYECKVMDKKGNCTQCPDRCPWNVHENSPWLYKNVTRKEQRTFAEKKFAYEQALMKKLNQDEVIGEMKLDISALKYKIDFCLNLINHHIDLLKERALLKHPPSKIEYIDWLIQEEQQIRTEGFENRIKTLNECKERDNYQETLEEVTFKLNRIGV